MKYSDYVKRARSLLEKVEMYQVEIAKMALSVCSIRHGGRSNGFYTVTNFADDIGIERKTLSHWVSIYRDILKKIGVTEPNSQQWSAAGASLRLLNSKRNIENQLNGEAKKKSNKLSSIPKEEIKALFVKIQSDPDSNDIVLDRLWKTSRHLLHITSTISVNLNDVDKIEMIKKFLFKSIENLESKTPANVVNALIQ